MKNYSEYAAYNFVYDTLDMITLFYPLEKTCYLGYFELEDFFAYYTSGYFTGWMFADIFANNFGYIYDAIITSIETIEMGNFYMAGYSFGSMLYMTFFIL